MFAQVLVASALVAIATAQTASTTVSQSMPPVATQGFNSGNVTSTEASQWCLGQLNTCPEICGGETEANQCHTDTLTYLCICANGTEPDCTAYKETLPFFICEATYVQCIAAHPNDAIAQGTCTANEQCGNLTAKSLGAPASSTAASSSASATATATGGASGSGSASASAASATHTGAASNTQQLTTGAFAAILMAAFKLFI